MGLALYDQDKVLVGASAVTALFNGHLGGRQEILMYLRNDDPTVYYTSIEIDLTTSGIHDTTGWTFKWKYGERQPTEGEWDTVNSGDPLAVPDLGTTGAADTSTYQPCWLKIYVPGGTEALKADYSIDVTALSKLLGT